MSQSKDKNKWNRRSFLKASGAAGAALGGAGCTGILYAVNGRKQCDLPGTALVAEGGRFH
jgi:hypothetical protein